MLFTSSRLLFTKETIICRPTQIKVTKRYSQAKHWMLACWKGWLFVGSQLIKEMPIKGGLPACSQLKCSPGCQWELQAGQHSDFWGCLAPAQKNCSLVIWQSIPDLGRIQGLLAREEGVLTSVMWQASSIGKSEEETPPCEGCCVFICTWLIFMTGLNPRSLQFSPCEHKH